MTPATGAAQTQERALRGSYIRNFPQRSFSLQFEQMSDLDPARARALAPLVWPKR
jgi:hypothetical protein